LNLKIRKFVLTWKNVEFFRKYMVRMVGARAKAGAGAGAGAEIFEKLEPELEPHKNLPTPQHFLT
jgi:hypothetical protein